MKTRILTLTALAAAAMVLAGCGASPAQPASTGEADATGTPATELRLGYFANVTHAPALVPTNELGLVGMEHHLIHRVAPLLRPTGRVGRLVLLLATDTAKHTTHTTTAASSRQASKPRSRTSSSHRSPTLYPSSGVGGGCSSRSGSATTR